MKIALSSKYVDVLLIPERTRKYAQLLDVFSFRQCTMYARRIEHHVSVFLHDSGIKLHGRSLILKMHSVVCSRLGTPAYTRILLYAWKKPGSRNRHVCEHDCSFFELWTRDVSLFDVPPLFLSDALVVLSFVVSSTLFPILIYTLTLTMTMTCNKCHSHVHQRTSQLY
jgi:hypothetical protein